MNVIEINFDGGFQPWLKYTCHRSKIKTEGDLEFKVDYTGPALLVGLYHCSNPPPFRNQNKIKILNYYFYLDEIDCDQRWLVSAIAQTRQRFIIKIYF